MAHDDDRGAASAPSDPQAQDPRLAALATAYQDALARRGRQEGFASAPDARDRRIQDLEDALRAEARSSQSLGAAVLVLEEEVAAVRRFLAEHRGRPIPDDARTADAVRAELRAAAASESEVRTALALFDGGELPSITSTPDAARAVAQLARHHREHARRLEVALAEREGELSADRAAIDEARKVLEGALREVGVEPDAGRGLVQVARLVASAGVRRAAPEVFA